jgi:DNA-binding transcriptional ArsR family regulator
MSRQDPKAALFTQFASVAKAVAHPYRLALLEQLAQGERSVEVLADRARVSVANASQHFNRCAEWDSSVHAERGSTSTTA